MGLLDTARNPAFGMGSVGRLVSYVSVLLVSCRAGWRAGFLCGRVGFCDTPTYLIAISEYILGLFTQKNMAYTKEQSHEHLLRRHSQPPQPKARP